MSKNQWKETFLSTTKFLNTTFLSWYPWSKWVYVAGYCRFFAGVGMSK
jgi:hypothetical protein